jgi:Tfp pilus assembly protein PilF
MSCPRTAEPLLRLALGLLLAWGAASSAAAAEGGGAAAPVSRELAQLAEEVRPLLNAEHAKEALAKIAAYAGPPHPWLQRLRGDALFSAGDYAQAVAAYRSALAGDAASVPAGTRANLGRALVGAGDQRAAAEELAAALVGGADPAATANDIAILVSCLLGSGEPRRALTAAQFGRLRFATDTGLMRAELAALQACGHWDDLAQAAEQLIGRKPAPAPAELQIAWQALVAARERAGSADEAAATAIAARSAKAIPASRLADDLHRAGLFARAESAYRAALAEEPHAPPLVLAAADNAAQAGDAAEGRALLAMLPAEESRRAEVRRLAAILAARAGDRAGARAQLGELIASGDGDGPIYLWAARLAQDDGDDTAALDLYARALVDERQTRAAHLSLAVLLGKLKRRDEALAHVRAVLDETPGDHHAAEIQAWIESLK